MFSTTNYSEYGRCSTTISGEQTNEICSIFLQMMFLFHNTKGQRKSDINLLVRDDLDIFVPILRRAWREIDGDAHDCLSKGCKMFVIFLNTLIGNPTCLLNYEISDDLDCH